MTRKRQKPMELHVHFPVPDDDCISRDLTRIVRKLHKTKTAKAASCGFFGGEFGYGTDFENDVFEMHWDRQFPECDCGGSKPKHLDDCDTITKREAWLDTRNKIGMVEETTPGLPEPDGGWANPIQAFMGMPMTYLTNTPTTYDEQDAWMKANPFPSCSCGEERAWLDRHGLRDVPDDDSSYFDRVGESARQFEHMPQCDLSIYARPHFLHKASGSTVDWYKYIGRDMRTELKCEWSKIVRECMASIATRRTAE